MKKLRDYQIKSIEETFVALKESDDPILFVMSVGGGKSICAGTICKRFEDINKNVLCLVNNAELVRNNSIAFQELGGHPSIFCASLNQKDYSNNIVFATPQSIISAIKNNHPISDRQFNLIIVDEAHAIAFKKHNSCFMRILRHYKQIYSAMRLLGLTGTPYRLESGDSESIVGEHALFKKSVANITTSWLIEHNYLVRPQFGIKSVDSIDMSSYHVEKTSKNKHKALTKIVDKNKRLTWEILQEVQSIMENRNGAFIFCSSISHCHEAFAALPSELTRIIIGETSDNERNQILTDARNKKIRYLVSVSCLLVGVDVPWFCTSVFLRPTKSFGILEQAIGRSLRLHPEKNDALILDYAQNLDSFQDIDHPIINEALSIKDKHEKEEEKPFICYVCGARAGLYTRRCHGMVLDSRCEYFFQFKDCPRCYVQNDVTARHCRACQSELIDPNAKLKRIQRETHLLDVLSASYDVTMFGMSPAPIIKICYTTSQGNVYENYMTNTERSRQIMYNKFLKVHCVKPSKYYKYIGNIHVMREMIREHDLMTPMKVECVRNEYGRFEVKKKIFE